jgi:predicted flap endonuclease-1-like 5' DNA nuclease
MSHVVNASAERRAPELRPRRGVESRGQNGRSTSPPEMRTVRRHDPERGRAAPRRRYRLPAKVAKILAQAGLTLAEVEPLTLEELLAIPGVGPRTVWRLERTLGRRFESHAPYWIKRGLSARLARTLAAAGIRTEQALKRMRREDLLKIKGIGPKTARTLLSLGAPPAAKPAARTFLERVPQARVWIEAGIIPCCAARLVRAGITDIAALARASREDLLGIRGIEKATLEKCERLLGRPLPSISAYWREKGLPPQLANALLRAGVHSIETLAAMSREDLLGIHGIGDRGLQHCEELLGRPMHLSRMVSRSSRL